jgi:hypothetical protein
MSKSVTRKREENIATYQRPYHPSCQRVSSLFSQNTVIPPFKSPSTFPRTCRVKAISLIFSPGEMTSTTVPDNTESPFGLISSSHQPRHSTHTHRPKVDPRRFSRIHLVVRQPEANLVVCYSFANRLGEFTNRISKMLYLMNYLQTRCLIKSDTRRHRPHTMIKADVVNS